MQAISVWTMASVNIKARLFFSLEITQFLSSEASSALSKDLSSRYKREVFKGEGSFSKEDKLAMLKHHNDLRGKPQASDMMMMQWDDKLEALAKQWAEKCIFEHSNIRRNAAGYKNVGENLYAGSGPFEPTSVVQAWYDEVDFYNYNTLGCTPGEMCGHYTQVVWASSSALGCAVKYCKPLVSFQSPTGGGYNVVCHYGPAGNWRGMRPYKKGEACSECPDTAKYCIRGLCSKYPQIGSISTTVHLQEFGFSLNIVLILLQCLISV